MNDLEIITNEIKAIANYIDRNSYSLSSLKSMLINVIDVIDRVMPNSSRNVVNLINENSQLHKENKILKEGILAYDKFADIVFLERRQRGNIEIYGTISGTDFDFEIDPNEYEKIRKAFELLKEVLDNEPKN